MRKKSSPPIGTYHSMTMKSFLFQSYLEAFHTYLIKCPSSVVGEDRSSHAVLSYSVFCGGLAHSFFIFLFIFTGYPLLASINVISVLIFLMAIWILRTSANQLLVIALSILEVFGHSYLATYYLGWDSGFHYYPFLFLGIFPLALFTWNARILGTLVILLSYILLWFMSHGENQNLVTGSPYQTLFSMMNLSIFILVMGIVTSFQGWLTQQSRLALARELKHLEEANQTIEVAYKDLQNAQAQLLESERLAGLGQLVGGIAHEINNPIAVIQSNTELLRHSIRSILREIPLFLETLSRKEKENFYEIVESSVKNREYLNTKEDRKRKKEIQKELFQVLGDETLSISLSEQISKLKLLPPYASYLKDLNVLQFKELLEKAQIFKDQSSSVQNIEIAVEKASRVVFSLKCYLNSEISLPKKEISLTEEINKALHVYDNYVIGKISILTEYPGEFKYHCESEKLFQVWKNLFFNSIQAMQDTDKEIKISIEITKTIPEILNPFFSAFPIREMLFTENRSWYLIKIRDSGAGILKENQDKIFSPFFSTKPLGEGIGLGLFTCKKVILDMGGNLFFQSMAGFTEFVVALPLEKSHN
jgi:signal transduction histidine kinase